MLRRTFLQAPAALAAARAARPATPDTITPKWPSLALNVRDFGAKGDGTTKDTAAIQQAIDRCSVLGGGEVLVPAGGYLTGALALRTDTLLRLEKDAAILGSPDLADYPVTQVRWEGKWIQGRVGLIYAIGANNIGVSGPGKITGNPAVGGRPNPRDPLRHPALVEPIGCSGILLEGFSATQGLMWAIHLANSRDISIRNLNIRTTTGNGDGIDVDSCRHVRIADCDIATGDDCIAIKSGRGSEAYLVHQPTEDVLITGCTLADSIFACIGIGSETSGGIRNVRIERCKFTGARTHAIYIKTRIGRGAFIENISANDLDIRKAEIRNIKVTGVTGPLIGIHNVTGKGLEGAAKIDGPKVPDLVPAPAKPYRLH
jgi:polygalacturonase